MITVINLQKSFTDAEMVFANLSFKIEHKTICSIVGPSGCGKTTMLNIIAGLDNPDSGRISIDYAQNFKPSLAYMLQDPLLLPWRTLAENALLGTEIINSKNSKVTELLDYYFEAFDIAEYKHIYPGASSGGMKQRVALIRTLLYSSPILLLDEPFSNLDFDIKLKIQRHIVNYHYKNGTTILLVTHDIEDAIALSDKVIVLSDKPTTIKSELFIELGISKRDPVEARKSTKFREYFIQIWDQLKYLKDNDANNKA